MFEFTALSFLNFKRLTLAGYPLDENLSRHSKFRSQALPLPLLFDFLDQVARSPVELLDHILLLFEAIVSVINALSELRVLINSEVTGLALNLDELLICLLYLLFLRLHAQALLLTASGLATLAHDRLQILWLRFLLHLGPDLHDRILQLHLLFILMQIELVLVQGREVGLVVV